MEDVTRNEQQQETPSNEQNGADMLPVMNGDCNGDVDDAEQDQEYDAVDNGFESSPEGNGDQVTDTGGMPCERNARTLMEELEEAERLSENQPGTDGQGSENGLSNSMGAPPTTDHAEVFVNSEPSIENNGVDNNSHETDENTVGNVSNCAQEDLEQNLSHQDSTKESETNEDIEKVSTPPNEKQSAVESQTADTSKDTCENVSTTGEASSGGEWRDREDPCGSAAGSLPLHGTVIREGDMVSFIADNLEEKIRQSFSSKKYSGPELSKPLVQPKFTPDESAIPKIDPTIIEDLEKQATRVADNVDLMLGNLKGTLHNMSAISVGYMQTHRDSVDRMGETVDSSVKSMYSLIAKCEELNKNMQPVYHLSTQIKEIKRRLDQLEAQFK